MRHPTVTCLFTFVIALFSFATISFGHAFPDHSDPAVGSKINTSPEEVRIWFNSELEPGFSKIRVEDSSGIRVDKGDCHVDNSDHKLLIVGITPLDSGKYHVSWIAVARDGHRTKGDYTFTVK